MKICRIKVVAGSVRRAPAGINQRSSLVVWLVVFFFATLGPGTQPHAAAQSLTLTNLGLTNQQLEFQANGSAASGLRIDGSSNLTDWLTLKTVSGFNGNFLFVDSNSPAFSTRFYRGALTLPSPIKSYRGNNLVLISQVPAGFGPGTIVYFDLNGNGAYSQQVTADENGLFTIALDTTGLPAATNLNMYFQSANGTLTSPATAMPIVRASASDPADAVPVNLATVGVTPAEPDICACCVCPECSNWTMPDAGNWAALPTDDLSTLHTTSLTPTDHGTELVTGKFRTSVPLLSFNTCRLGFAFALHYASLVNYAGPVGNSCSHSYNLMVVQNSASAGQIITPDLRVYSISSGDGRNWTLPPGFYSTLVLNTNRHRWTLTHYGGRKVELYQATLGYDGSGLLQAITTDLGQTETLGYNTNGILATFTDHLGRTWNIGHDSAGRLTQIVTPSSQYANIPAGTLLTTATLADALVTQARTTTLGYTNLNYPSHLTSITDDRGAVPRALVYDSSGRVAQNVINGHAQSYTYNLLTGSPQPLPTLFTGNVVTRVRDREGNLSDFEMQTSGGPLGGGQWMVAQQVNWTATGQGLPALRSGEPKYYSQRFLQNCDCGRPLMVCQPFSDQDTNTLTFDPTTGIPQNWPHMIFTYNNNRQVTVYHYTDGANSIQMILSYQTNSYGVSNQFSRLLTQTDPRAQDTNFIYIGLNFVHTFAYDGRGNPTNHTAPLVTRGVGPPQVVSESRAYNLRGQVISRTDANGNLTTTTYNTGAATGGDINSQGNYGGYVHSVTRGAAGSADAAPLLTTTYKVNALGMVTQKTDPNGHSYIYQFNNMGERILATLPAVTLWIGATPAYQLTTVFDGAGNPVMVRSSNLDYDGTVPGNATIDRSRSYDAANNLLAERVQVDAVPANDLITSYSYNSNDLLVVVQKPSGNRLFRIYDTRLLLYKTFYGVAPGSSVTNGYPASKTATTLGTTAFVGYQQDTYDSRANRTQVRDGRGNTNYFFYDFKNRLTATSDQNQNGRTLAYDAASEVLTEQAGAVSRANGVITSMLSRSYNRYDELGRRYQTVQDTNTSTDESGLVDPSAGQNPSRTTLFDAGGRVRAATDANLNTTGYAYDAANRQTTVTDPQGDMVQNAYDSNGNVVSITEQDVPGAGATGLTQTYVTTLVYDELNRRIAQHNLGLNGNSLDDVMRFAYDSRNNTRLVQDANTNFTLTGYDYQNRPITAARFDGDPTTGAGTPNQLSRTEAVYDPDGNKVEDHAFSNVASNTSIQITRYAYDNLDRLIRTVYPDSDDPINGSNNGLDGIYNRVEVSYDPVSNPILVKEQRGVFFTNFYDPANRLSSQVVALPAGVAGASRQAFGYDALNRVTSAQNNYASVLRFYDALSRLVTERQFIRLDGSGFVNGWEQQVVLNHYFDSQDNETNLVAMSGAHTDLSVSRRFDSLNRVQSISAAYLNVPNSDVVTYAYFGRDRVQSKTLGNGAIMTNTFDAKRRLASLTWVSPSNQTLVGFQYAYDSMDNALSERWLHDNGSYDQFQLDHKDELTGAAYRSTNAAPPGVFPSTFAYDNNYNRTLAAFGGPFAAQPTNSDSYAIAPANQYTQLTRNGAPLNPTNDLAGNLTSVPVLPVSGINNQPDVAAACASDAYNRLLSVNTGVTPVQDYVYDALGRRIATVTGPAPGTIPVRRFIWDGWKTVEEQLFNPGATPASAPSTLERIYVDGPQMDEHLLAAIDRNGDGVLGPANLNRMDISADQWYYLLPDRSGSTTALLAANDPNQTLEYYRYNAYGEATVLPVVDNNNDGYEDTPLDLSDNFAQGAERSSAEHGNVFLFTGQPFDDQTGLFYYRKRYYEARSGRFISRDPIPYADGDLNLYAYVQDNPVNRFDPTGEVVMGHVTCDGKGGFQPALTDAGKKLLPCKQAVVISHENRHIEDIKRIAPDGCKGKKAGAGPIGIEPASALKESEQNAWGDTFDQTGKYIKECCDECPCTKSADGEFNARKALCQADCGSPDLKDCCKWMRQTHAKAEKYKTDYSPPSGDEEW